MSQESTPLSETPLVCVVDDDPSVCKALARLLGSDGWAVRCFAAGEDFLAHIREEFVALAIIDVWMPGLSGPEVLALLQEYSPQTRAILISARPESRYGEAPGGTILLNKPFPNEVLLAAARHVLAGAPAAAAPDGAAESA